MSDLWAVFEDNRIITGSPIGDYDTALDYQLVAEGDGGGFRPGDLEVRAVCELHETHPEETCEETAPSEVDLLGRVVEGLRKLDDQ